MPTTKNYACKTCDFSFDSPSGLGQHVAIAHQECGVCGETFEGVDERAYTELPLIGTVVSHVGMPPTRGRRLPVHSHNDPYERRQRTGRDVAATAVRRL